MTTLRPALAAFAMLLAPCIASASDAVSLADMFAGQSPYETGDAQKMKIKIVAGLYGSDVTMRLKVTGITALNSNGTAIYPRLASQANGDVGYFTTMSIYAVEAGAQTVLPMGVKIAGCLRLGENTTGITQEIGSNSNLGGKLHETAMSWYRAMFGLNLNASLDMQKFRGTVYWDFTFGAGMFDNQILMSACVDGWYKALVNRFGVKASYDLDFIRPFVSAGLLWYTGFADLTEADDNTPRTYRIRFGAHNPLTFGVGAEYFAEKHVYVRFEATIGSEMTFEVTLGAAIG